MKLILLAILGIHSAGAQPTPELTPSALPLEAVPVAVDSSTAVSQSTAAPTASPVAPDSTTPSTTKSQTESATNLQNPQTVQPVEQNSGPPSIPGIGGNSAGSVDSLKEAEAYDFNPQSLSRDPFQPPDALASTKIDDLVFYDVAQMKLVATMTGLGPSRAMIVLPNNTTHFVQPGTALGRNKGKVFKILADELVIKETFTDFRGRVRSELTTLSIPKD